MNGRWPRLLAAAVAAACLRATVVIGQSTIDVGPFSSAAPGGPFPAGWRELDFPKIPRHTSYEVVKEATEVVVRAISDRSASALVRPIRIDAKAYPIITWRWKVKNLIAKANAHAKSGDDYPARVYVTFEYDAKKLGFLERAQFEAARLFYGEYPPTAAIDYIWESREPVGTVIPNAYSSRSKMVVVESGAGKVGRWVDEERNLLEDYRNAFGEDPPMTSAVAIMTDSDNTGEAATAWYGDIAFEAKPPPTP